MVEVLPFLAVFARVILISYCSSDQLFLFLMLDERGFVNKCLVAALLLFCIHMSVHGGRYVSHKVISTDVELIGGKEFSHSVMSDMGVVHEDFSIDRVPVQKDDFYHAWESAYLKEARLERQDRVDRQKSRFDFINASQAAILEKTVKKTVFDARQMLDRLNHATLQPYLKFDVSGIRSSHHLGEIKQILEQADAGIKKMVKGHDLQGLKEFLQHIDLWPDQLETCFKNSVQAAIGQCDDTASLKELLALMSVA